MAESKCCKKCKGKMKQTGKRWEQTGRGHYAGFDVIIYTCTKCGDTHEEWIGVD